MVLQPAAKDYPDTTALYVDVLTRVIRRVANGPAHVDGNLRAGFPHNRMRESTLLVLRS